MTGSASIAFLVDEHLLTQEIRGMLEARGHPVSFVKAASRDQGILAAAQQDGLLIITADRWFLEELFRFPVGHRRCYQREGVVQVPGTWAAARLRLMTYLPIIEYLADIRRTQTDCRVAIDLFRREIRIHEP